MARRRINFLANRPVTEETGDVLKVYYASWRKVNSMANAPFAALYNSFKEEHLASLDAGPLRLYLYFSFSANNSSGHSWHSIQTMAKFFKTQTRTIDNWIKVLVDKELIYRERTDKLSNTTFLIPYTDTMMPMIPSKKHNSDNQELFDDLISIVKRREALYGEIVRVHHLFQWKIKNGKAITDESNQMIVVITKRKNGVIIAHFHYLKRLSGYGVNEIDIDDVATFESPFVYKDKPVKGVAINDAISIRAPKNVKDLLDLFKQFDQGNDIDFSLHPRLEYGLVSELIPDSVEELEE